MDDARRDRQAIVAPRRPPAAPVKGLRLVGWSAGSAALLGGAAIAMLVGHMPLHAGGRQKPTLYGATFAPLGGDRPGLVVTSLRSHAEDAPAAVSEPPLRVGDTVLAIDDQPVMSFGQLRDEAARHANSPVRLRVARDHGLVTITLLRTGPGGLRGQQDLID
ncbi:MAG: PDZ domain-containing protein [Sphingomonas pseudosanguinis]|uniref:PDZ domain-containing protein n=1 Tax=Sphingomonas pseudosanguinis TaxID=413712 RepID=UPI00391B64BF